MIYSIITSSSIEYPYYLHYLHYAVDNFRVRYNLKVYRHERKGFIRMTNMTTMSSLSFNFRTQVNHYEL